MNERERLIERADARFELAAEVISLRRDRDRIMGAAIALVRHLKENGEIGPGAHDAGWRYVENLAAAVGEDFE